MVKPIRHWKQRWNPDAEFIFGRGMMFNGKTYKPGDKVPTSIKATPGKLRRFWDSGFIQLSQKKSKKKPKVPETAAVTVDIIEDVTPEWFPPEWKFFLLADNKGYRFTNATDESSIEIAEGNKDAFLQDMMETAPEEGEE